MSIKIAFLVKQRILSIVGFLEKYLIFEVLNLLVFYVVDSPDNQSVFKLTSVNNTKSFSRKGSASEFIC